MGKKDRKLSGTGKDVEIDLRGIEGRSRGTYNEYTLYEIIKGLVKACF